MITYTITYEGQVHYTDSTSVFSLDEFNPITSNVTFDVGPFDDGIDNGREICK